MKSPRRTTLASSVLTGRCAEHPRLRLCRREEPAAPGSGSGGNGGGVVAPPIPRVAVDRRLRRRRRRCVLQANGTMLSGSATYMATGHFMDGHTEDVTSRVGWSSQFSTLTVVRGVANVRAPGVFTGHRGRRLDHGDGAAESDVPGQPDGQWLRPERPGVARRLGHRLDPDRLSAGPRDLPAQPEPGDRCTSRRRRGRTRRASTSRSIMSSTSTTTPLCQPGAGTGCYVDLPLELTQLFVAVSETKRRAGDRARGRPGRAAHRVGADQRRLGQRAAVGRPLLLDDAGPGDRPRLHATQQRRQHAGHHRHRHPALRLRQGRRDGAAAGLHRSRSRRRRSSARRRRPPTAPSASAATPSAATARPWR